MPLRTPDNTLMAHTRMRCDSMNFEQLRLRIARIRDPQKMFAFIIEIGNRAVTGSSVFQRLRPIARERLRMLGYDELGRELRITPTDDIRTIDIGYSQPTVFLGMSRGTELIFTSPLLRRKFDDLVRSLLDSGTKARYIAMAFGISTKELCEWLARAGWKKREIDAIINEHETYLNKPMIRKITLKKGPE